MRISQFQSDHAWDDMISSFFQGRGVFTQVMFTCLV